MPNESLLDLLFATQVITSSAPIPTFIPPTVPSVTVPTVSVGTDVTRRAEKATAAARRLLGESATQERVEALAIALMPIEDADLDRVYLKEIDPDDPTGSRYDRNEVL